MTRLLFELGSGQTCPCLSIVIPTYDRRSQLLYTLGKLLPQLASGVEVVVVDNSSSSYDSLDLRGQLQVQSGIVRVYRNDFNIGGSANIMRALECAASDWVWLLSDDDEVQVNSVVKVLENIARVTSMHSAILFHFNAAPWPACEVDVYGAEVFMGHTRFIFRSMFLSAWVVRKSLLKLHFRLAYQNLTTCCPHVVLAIASLSTGGGVRFSSDVVADYKKPEAGESWSLLTIYPGAVSLMEIRFGLVEAKYLKFRQAVQAELSMYLGAYVVQVASSDAIALTQKSILIKSALGRVGDSALGVSLWRFCVLNKAIRVLAWFPSWIGIALLSLLFSKTSRSGSDNRW